MAKKQLKTPSITLADGTTVPLADVEHITPDLRPLAVPIDSLTPDPRNARTHGDKNRAAIAKSLQQNGQLKPISVDANGTILAGNGTWAEAKALGWKYIARARTTLTGAAAMRWALADNRTGELAEWDAAELERQSQELADELDGFDLGDIGFNAGELDALLEGNSVAAHGFAPRPKPDPSNFQPESPDQQPRLDQRKPVCCPKCNHEFVAGK